MLTIEEVFGGFVGRRLAFVGDGGDNVAHSLLEVASAHRLDLTIACPPEYAPDENVLADARAARRDLGADSDSRPRSCRSRDGADAVYADVWASMGEESEREERAHLPARPSRSPSS